MSLDSANSFERQDIGLPRECSRIGEKRRPLGEFTAPGGFESVLSIQVIVAGRHMELSAVTSGDILRDDDVLRTGTRISGAACSRLIGAHVVGLSRCLRLGCVSSPREVVTKRDPKRRHRRRRGSGD